MMHSKQRDILVLFLFLLFMRIAPVIATFLGTNLFPSGGADPLLYLGGARSILSGNINPFNFFSPVYFYFVAACLYLGGGHGLAAIGATAVIGWLTVIGVYHLAMRLFNEKAAFFAALLTGIYPNLIYFGANLFPETLAIFWIVFSFLMIVKYMHTSQKYYLLISGILWGLASQTRGGLHYFALFIALSVLIYDYRGKKMLLWKPVAAYLMATCLTIVTIGIIVFPTHGEFALNSKSGIGSFVHGLNRITTSCADYGDVVGNIFYHINSCVYDIKDCGEKWPEGTQIFSKDIFELGTVQILSKAARFIAESPLLYIKNSLRKLSCFWSPNQLVIGDIKTTFQNVNNLIVGGVCLGISLLYVFIICGGLWGMSLSRDPFRPIFISFIIFYCVMIFLTVGNSKLRIPFMPFFIMYCSYFIISINRKGPSWRKAIFKNGF
jgi:4-amino-4-deoxy-L-arabinose transferase-like glycosyltransferase